MSARFVLKTETVFVAKLMYCQCSAINFQATTRHFHHPNSVTHLQKMRESRTNKNKSYERSFWRHDRTGHKYGLSVWIDFWHASHTAHGKRQNIEFFFARLRRPPNKNEARINMRMQTRRGLIFFSPPVACVSLAFFFLSCEICIILFSIRKWFSSNPAVYVN